MKSKVKIGKITKKQIIKMNKKISRDIELENQVGWKAICKIHKSKKQYNRKFKMDHDDVY